MNHDHPNRSRLEQLAREASEAAHAPYSGHRVGAVVVDGDGRTHLGCNVENASFGLTICAERNALAAAVVAGAVDLHTIVIYAPGERPWPPCGACRQFISEMMRQDAIVLSCCDSDEKREWQAADLLPDAFRLD